MFGLGMPELLIIMMVVLLIFGAGKLPEIGGAIGKGIRGFRNEVPPKSRDYHKTQEGTAAGEETQTILFKKEGT